MTAPLDGIHVLDLSWVMVGPVSGRYLADLGADVIKVESSRRIDPVRTLGPFKDGRTGPERSVSYHNLNAGKRCITLDIRKPEGRELVLRLAEWADVVLESFTPGVLDELQLGYAELSARNPKLIMASTAILGQTGPDAKGTSGVGTMGAAMSGATYQFGWPDRPPCGPFGPWTDGVAPRFIVASILAALHRRTRTGEGCYIDVAQAEAGVQFMMPAYYEFAANGKIPERRGVAGSPLRVPEGVYRCAGEDRWVAISASDSTALGIAAQHHRRCAARVAIRHGARPGPQSRRDRSRRFPRGPRPGIRRDRSRRSNRQAFPRISSAAASTSCAIRTCIISDISKNSPIRSSAKLRSKVRDARSIARRCSERGAARASANIRRKFSKRSVDLSKDEIAQLAEAGVLA